jgi:Coatomer (COPI) alpha subunit C-terminus
MTIELERRTTINNQQDISSFPEDVRKRAFELSAYFTIPEMESFAVTLALFSAMNFAHKNKQFSSALSFANSLIEKGTNARFKENVSCHHPRLLPPPQPLLKSTTANTCIYNRHEKLRQFASAIQMTA